MSVSAQIKTAWVFSLIRFACKACDPSAVHVQVNALLLRDLQTMQAHLSSNKIYLWADDNSKDNELHLYSVNSLIPLNGEEPVMLDWLICKPVG